MGKHFCIEITRTQPYMSEMNSDEHTISLPSEKEVQPDGSTMLLEVTLNQRGRWRVHANDEDDLFPSDFHAHNLEDGTRLNLYTGDIFDQSGRVVVGRMREQDMLFYMRKLMKSENTNITRKMKDARLAKWIAQVKTTA